MRSPFLQNDASKIYELPNITLLVLAFTIPALILGEATTTTYYGPGVNTLVTDPTITSGPATLSTSGRLTIPVYSSSGYVRETANFQAAPGATYAVDTTSGAIVCTPPASPADGAFFVVIDIAQKWRTNSFAVGTNQNFFIDTINTSPVAGAYNLLLPPNWGSTPSPWQGPTTFVYDSAISAWSVQY